MKTAIVSLLTCNMVASQASHQVLKASKTLGVTPLEMVDIMDRVYNSGTSASHKTRLRGENHDSVQRLRAEQALNKKGDQE